MRTANAGSRQRRSIQTSHNFRSAGIGNSFASPEHATDSLCASFVTFHGFDGMSHQTICLLLQTVHCRCCGNRTDNPGDSFDLLTATFTCRRELSLA
jgi:hypothetical protein